MKQFFYGCCMALVVISCKSDNQNTMLVNGTIKGLKKGTVYLHKQIDTAFVAVDSVFLDGVNTFSLEDEIESPEMYYLSLGQDENKSIPFFGDRGAITINTVLDKFTIGAKVAGRKNQQLLVEYQAMIQQFRNKDLDLIKADFESKGDSLKRDSILKLANSLLKRRYFYTTNFAVKNSDAEIAPYLALTELYNANISLLDTVNNSLSDQVKASKYGKELDKYISEIKASN